VALFVYDPNAVEKPYVEDPELSIVREVVPVIPEGLEGEGLKAFNIFKQFDFKDQVKYINGLLL
jgi:hypothetical protein